MKKVAPITALFLDIGGVLLNDGWSHQSREMAAMVFNLDLAEINHRHQLTVETYEVDKLTLKEYLSLVVFYREQSFSRIEFQKFMFEQSKPHPHPRMIKLIRKLKTQYGLKICVVSNEGRELNEYRIRKFKLDGFVDSFISSCFVHVRKPDAEIFQLALGITQAPARHIVYIENTPCLSKSRKVWVFEAFYTPITRPHVRSWLPLDWMLRNDRTVIRKTDSP